MARPRKILQDGAMTIPRGILKEGDRIAINEEKVTVYNEKGNKLWPEPSVLSRLRIVQQYVQYIALIDVADIVPYSLYGRVETIFPKLGLVVKRKFGFLGYNWGYGTIREARDGETAAVLTAPVSLHIYFQHPIDERFLADNASKFEDIVVYLRKEMAIYRGSVIEEF